MPRTYSPALALGTSPGLVFTSPKDSVGGKFSFGLKRRSSTGLIGTPSSDYDFDPEAEDSDAIYATSNTCNTSNSALNSRRVALLSTPTAVSSNISAETATTFIATAPIDWSSRIGGKLSPDNMISASRRSCSDRSASGKSSRSSSKSSRNVSAITTATATANAATITTTNTANTPPPSKARETPRSLADLPPPSSQPRKFPRSGVVVSRGHERGDWGLSTVASHSPPSSLENLFAMQKNRPGKRKRRESRHRQQNRPARGLIQGPDTLSALEIEKRILDKEKEFAQRQQVIYDALLQAAQNTVGYQYRSYSYWWEAAGRQAIAEDCAVPRRGRPVRTADIAAIARPTEVLLVSAQTVTGEEARERSNAEMVLLPKRQVNVAKKSRSKSMLAQRQIYGPEKVSALEKDQRTLDKEKEFAQRQQVIYDALLQAAQNTVGYQYRSYSYWWEAAGRQAIAEDCAVPRRGRPVQSAAVLRPIEVVPVSDNERIEDEAGDRTKGEVVKIAERKVELAEKMESKEEAGAPREAVAWPPLSAKAVQDVAKADKRRQAELYEKLVQEARCAGVFGKGRHSWLKLWEGAGRRIALEATTTARSCRGELSPNTSSPKVRAFEVGVESAVDVSGEDQVVASAGVVAIELEEGADEELLGGSEGEELPDESEEHVPGGAGEEAMEIDLEQAKFPAIERGFLEQQGKVGGRGLKRKRLGSVRNPKSKLAQGHIQGPEDMSALEKDKRTLEKEKIFSRRQQAIYEELYQAAQDTDECQPRSYLHYWEVAGRQAIAEDCAVPRRARPVQSTAVLRPTEVVPVSIDTAQGEERMVERKIVEKNYTVSSALGEEVQEEARSLISAGAVKEGMMPAATDSAARSDSICTICHEVERLVYCELCPRAYHPGCIDTGRIVRRQFCCAMIRTATTADNVCTSRVEPIFSPIG